MPGMKNAADLSHRQEFLDELEVTDRRIEELREHREAMLERIRLSRGVSRLGHNFNYLLSEKQIVRHIRFFKIHRERLSTHYRRMFGEGLLEDPWEDRRG